MGSLFKLNQGLIHFVPISQNQGRITGNDFSAKAVLEVRNPPSAGRRWAAETSALQVGAADRSRVLGPNPRRCAPFFRGDPLLDLVSSMRALRRGYASINTHVFYSAQRRVTVKS